MTVFWRSWVLALGMVGACGGRVVVEQGDEPGGAGGTGGGGGSSEVAVAACQTWCESYPAGCAQVEGCMDRCLERASYLTPCEAEMEAQLLCLAAHAPPDASDCSTPKGCEPELDALIACVYPAGPCEIPVCKTGSGLGAPRLECNFQCGGVLYTSACGEVGSGVGFPMDCECQIDGQVVGTCQSVTSLGATSLGCCSVYFATSQ